MLLRQHQRRIRGRRVALYLFQNSFLQRLGKFDHTGKARCGMRRKGFEQNMIDFGFKEALRIELGGRSIQQRSRVASRWWLVAGEQETRYEGKRVLIDRILVVSMFFWFSCTKIIQPNVNPAEWTAEVRHPYKATGPNVLMHDTAFMQVKETLSRLGDHIGNMWQFPGFPGFLPGQQISQGAVFVVGVDQVEVAARVSQA